MSQNELFLTSQVKRFWMEKLKKIAKIIFSEMISLINIPYKYMYLAFNIKMFIASFNSRKAKFVFIFFRAKNRK